MANSSTANNTAYSQPLRQTLESKGYSVNWSGNGLPISVSKAGKTYSVSPGQYKIVNGVAQVSPDTIVNITGYVPARSALEKQGNEVGWNQSTGEVTAKNILDSASYAFKPDLNMNGTTYLDPNRLKIIEERLTPTTTTASGVSEAQNQYYQQQQKLIDNQNNQITQYAKQLSDGLLAITTAYQANYAQALQQMQSLTQPSQSSPQVNEAIEALRSRLDQNVGDLITEMKARGIYSPELLKDQEDKLSKGELTDEQALYAHWLDNQQNQIFDATLKLASMGTDYANGIASLQQNQALEPMQVLEDNANNIFNQQSTLNQQKINDATQLKEWIAQQRQSAAQAAAESDLANKELEQEWNTAILPYQQMTKYEQGELTAEQQALQQAWNKALLPYQQMTKYQQGMLANDAASLAAQQQYMNGRLSLSAKSNLNSAFQNASKSTGVSLALLEAVAKQESGFNQNAKSGAGAIGIMQLMPGTARGVGVNAYDATQNILGGALVLKNNLSRFHGDVRLALAAYNAGGGAVSKAIKKAGTTDWNSVKKYLPSETRNYVPAVLANL